MPKYAVISQLIAARIKASLSQKELAERLGTIQSAISRLKAGNINPTNSFRKSCLCNWFKTNHSTLSLKENV